VGFCVAWAGAAPALDDVTYPFEDGTPAARKAAKPAKKTAAKPAATPATAIPLPPARPGEPAKTAAVTVKVPTPEPKPEAEAKPEPKPDAEAGPKDDTKPEPKAANGNGELAGVTSDEREAIGWRVVLDPATGIRLGLPVKWVPQSKPAPHGTHWSSRHGDVQIHTFRIRTTESIKTLFEKEKREPANRKIESSAVKGDSFIVTGLQGLKKFGVRAQLRSGELRGYTVLFDQAMQGIVAPVTAAMAAAFAPFPDGTAPIAPLARPVDYGTGLIVSSDGHVLTDRRLADSCSVIAVSGLGNAERIAVDRNNALALLRVYGKRDLAVAAFAHDAPTADFALAAIPDPHIQDGGRKLTEVRAQLGDGNAIRLRQPVPLGGFSGAAALDAQGRVLGMMETRNAQLASADAALPPVRLVPASAIRDFLTTHHVVPPQASADSRAAVVRVICVRKK
jgi:hypothetical protein